MTHEVVESDNTGDEIKRVHRYVCLAWAGTIGDGTAAKYGVIGSVGYVISRGLAKYETRTVTVTAPAPAPAPPTTLAPPPQPPVA